MCKHFLEATQGALAFKNALYPVGAAVARLVKTSSDLVSYLESAARAGLLKIADAPPGYLTINFASNHPAVNGPHMFFRVVAAR